MSELENVMQGSTELYFNSRIQDDPKNSSDKLRNFTEQQNSFHLYHPLVTARLNIQQK